MMYLNLALLVSGVFGHANMINPVPRQSNGVDPWGSRNQCGSSDPYSKAGFYPGEYCGLGCVGEACLWYQIGCFIGCPTCSLTGKDLYPTAEDLRLAGNCHPIEPTLNDKNLRTYNIDNESTEGDWTKVNPWRAPGTTGAGNPAFNPCGISSGGKNFAKIPPATGYPQGFNGTDLPELSGVKNMWKAGSEQEVEWAIYANHGGGYSYRLCKKDAAGKVTEDCFQKMPLDFADEKTKIVYHDGSRDSFNIDAVTTSNGTFPAGSQWRKNPIPMCNCDIGQGCDKGLMFESKWDDGYGAGPYAVKNAPKHDLEGAMPFSMVDKVKVPAGISGEYMLSFRWDCEQTPQVWNSCADITIEA